jgi:hypothetical protein
MKWFFLILFLASCANYTQQTKTSFKKFDFSKELSFQKFEIELDHYVKQSSYPDINE